MLSSFLKKISSALDKGEFITFFCHCAVSYSGRAESYLDFGDRLIMIKQDRGLLIHQPVGGMPINYLRPPANIEFSLEKSDDDDEVPYLLLHATSKTDEIVVQITEIHDFVSRRLDDGQKQSLSGTEAEMSDMLRDDPSIISQAINKEFIPLSREEHMKYGFIDVFGHLGDGTLAVVECKRYTAGLAGVTQLLRYVEKMKKVKGIDKVVGIMAAPAITPNAQAMLDEYGFTFARVIPPKQKLNEKKVQKKIDSFFS